MSAEIPVTPEKEKIVKSFSDTNYFAKGTYKREFAELFSTSALANYFTKTVLAPLERWRIVKQTQLSYDLRPNKIKSFSQYLTSILSYKQSSPRSKDGLPYGGETQLIAGCISGNSFHKFSYSTL
jgi:hypothetical protein